jgi:hypothetical protein
MDKQEECNCGVGDAGSDIGHFEDCPALKDKQEEWANDWNGLCDFWCHPDFRNEMKEHGLKFIKAMRSKDRDTLIERIESKKSPNQAISEYFSGWNFALDSVKQIILEVMK